MEDAMIDDLGEGRDDPGKVICTGLWRKSGKRAGLGWSRCGSRQVAGAKGAKGGKGRKEGRKLFCSDLQRLGSYDARNCQNQPAQTQHKKKSTAETKRKARSAQRRQGQ